MRELAISIYLTGFKVFFTLFKLFPLKKRVTFLISFPDNSMYIYKELQRQGIDIEVIFLCHSRCFNVFKKINNATYLVESRNIIHTIIGIYHLATSKQIIMDNYYGFLASTKFKEDVSCIQIWHSVGAIKQFGAEDPTNANRTPAALKRFKRVYDQFDRVVVGSDFMGDIFKKAFLIKEDVILKSGIPRTDFFFDERKQEQTKRSLYENNPVLKEKKVILYAPTFRRYENAIESVKLDIGKMYAKLKDEYVLLIKLHPAIKLELDLGDNYQDFAFDYGEYPDVNELLIITDILITDYSSIPMEFARLRRKMIFFAHDLATYEKDNGLWEIYESSVPGPVVQNTDEIIEFVLDTTVDMAQIEAYAKKWAEYCRGNSSEKLVNILFGE